MSDIFYIEELQEEGHRLREELEKANAEREEVQLKWQRLYGEIDCRIEHGADSNGHLEAIRKMMQKIEKEK